MVLIVILGIISLALLLYGTQFTTGALAIRECHRTRQSLLLRPSTHPPPRLAASSSHVCMSWGLA